MKVCAVTDPQIFPTKDILNQFLEYVVQEIEMLAKLYNIRIDDESTVSLTNNNHISVTKEYTEASSQQFVHEQKSEQSGSSSVTKRNKKNLNTGSNTAALVQRFEKEHNMDDNGNLILKTVVSTGAK